MDSTDQNPIDPAHNAVDISKILLPKKEASPDSAQRVNAGALLEQEQAAKEEKPDGQNGLAREGAPQEGAAIRETRGPFDQQVSPPQDSIKQLETYQGDI
jgi:hypothetical protein